MTVATETQEKNIKSDTLSFDDCMCLENQKNGEIYPFETLDLIISLKEQKNEI